MELSLKGGAEIEGAIAKQEVNALQKPQGKARRKNVGGSSQSSSRNAGDMHCYRCGDKTHLAKKCKHQNTVCSYCHIKGHLERVCMKKAAGKKPDAVPSGGRQGPSRTHQIEQRSDDGSVDNISVGEICTVVGRPGDAKLWATVTINGVQIRLEMDTGCPVSIINEECYQQNFQHIPLRESTLKLVSYCDSNIDVRGFFDAEVKYLSCRKLLPLYVVGSTKHPLLGREWLKALDVDWNTVLQSSSVNAIAPASTTALLQQLFSKYADVFEDSIGRISSVQANLRLKPNAKPVFLKARKIPFNVKKVVEDELDKLVVQGVLSKVDHSEWATPIVPVKKSENRVRICGDYKQTVNPLLIVDRHPLPTVDELFSSLAGGDKFSKIDLVQAYLQLEVAPED